MRLMDHSNKLERMTSVHLALGSIGGVIWNTIQKHHWEV